MSNKKIIKKNVYFCYVAREDGCQGKATVNNPYGCCSSCAAAIAAEEQLVAAEEEENASS